MNIFGTITLLILSAALSFVDPRPQNKPMDYHAFLAEYFGYFNAHDWESMAAMYAETASFKDPSLGAGVHVRDRAEIIAHYTELSEMIPDVRDSLVQLYPSGNTVTVEFISTGTAPDGSKFQLPICAILTIEGGQIVKDYVYYDNF